MVHTIGNPAKIIFETEEELLICLKIQEPDVTATLPNDDYVNQRQRHNSVQNIIDQVSHNLEEARAQTVIHEQRLVQSRISSNQGKVVVLIPIGLPGMGKTHFFETQLKPSLAK